MLFIDSLVRQLIPQLSSDAKLSVACLSTTNPVYLVFNGEEPHPAFVVRMADSEEICRVHRVTQRLFTVVGDIVAEPIALSEFGKHKVAIQKGLKGIPWFQIATNYQTPAQWKELRGQALSTLNQLHRGIRTFSDWVTLCEPGQEIRRCLRRCLASGTELSLRVQQQVDVLGQQLDGIGNIPVYCQHGDYCLNNVLVEAGQTHVIDFEDFGMTSMPLHDEITLALSVYSQAPQAVHTTLKQEVNACVKDGLTYFGLDRSMLPAFYMHHLLLRLGDWSQGSRREQYRKWLLSMLDEFVQDPFLYFDT